MSQSPSIGRIVHYHSRGSADGVFKPEPRAAMITATFPDGSASLAVVNPTGLFFDSAVPHSEEPKPGHWTWPPRV